MSRRLRLAALALTVVTVNAVVPAIADAAPSCPYAAGPAATNKSNKLFLYFPTAADAAFREFGLGGFPTSPAARFDAADLASYTGTTADLRDAVRDVVVDDYCEFNVEVQSTTTAPGTSAARRNTVAVGTDGAGGLYGMAERVDTGDANTVDFSRVWGGSYQADEGGAGGALNGTLSSLARWATSIGGTAAHEAGHNYGLSHTDGETVRPGEDALTRHIMPAGSNLDGEQRAGYRRHFNDRSFSLLASNVGLTMQTMHNWDLVNPNAQTAHRLRMEFLSANPAAVLAASYTGYSSPWGTATMTGPLGTQVFKGQTLNRYRIEWTRPQAWSGGAAGQVPGGTTFHIGATVSGVSPTPDSVIITQLQLQDAGGTPLALQPRLPGYDAGTLDVADGGLDLRFFNVDGPEPLQLRDVVVRNLPRVLSIDAMMAGTDNLFDFEGERFTPWPGSRTVLERSPDIPRDGVQAVEVARLGQGRNILERVGPDCDKGDNRTGVPDTGGGCLPGVNVDLFPATTMYITATVVTPNMRHWDRALARYVVGDVETRVFLQVAGRHPDLNDNGTDDAIDIFTGRSSDRDQDGVPDELASGEVGGTVPGTLSLSLGAPASFGTFVPGLTREYTASTTATVTSTAGETTLSVADPSSLATGRLVNGAFALASPLQAGAGGAFAPVGSAAAPTVLRAWTEPFGSESVPVTLKQPIAAGDALRTGTYSKRLTFTLSTVTP